MDKITFTFYIDLSLNLEYLLGLWSWYVLLVWTDALQANGVEDQDYDAIYVELSGETKKRKQIPGAG